MNGILSASSFCEVTDSHNYLLHSSSHPQHVKKAIPFSQYLRLTRGVKILCVLHLH